MAAALIIPIRRYQKDKLPIEPLPDPVPWIDLVTNEDPVLNGSRVDRLPPSARKVRVVNRASVIADHGSYWGNTDQFVARVALRIGRLDPGLRLMCAGPAGTARDIGSHLKRSWRRREERVGVLERARILVSAATVLLLVTRHPEMQSIGLALARLVGPGVYAAISWLPNVVRQNLPFTTSTEAIVGVVVVLVLALIGYKILVAIWDAWGGSDTAAQWAGVPPNRESGIVWAFYIWILVLLVAMVAVAIVGPRNLIRGIEYAWENRDNVVQAWTRLYASSIVLGMAATVLAVDRRTRRVDEHKLALIIAGTGLALILELPLALRWPGETQPGWAILTGLLIEIAALILVIVLAAPIGRLIAALNSRLPTPPHPSASKGPFATKFDILGVIGFPIAAIGILLADRTGLVAQLVAGLAVLAALLLTFALATKGSSGQLRVVGWIGVLFCLAILALGIRDLITP